MEGFLSRILLGVAFGSVLLIAALPVWAHLG